MQLRNPNGPQSREEIYDALNAFGATEYTALQDLRNTNKLCARCRAANWETVQLYLTIAGDEFAYPSQPLWSLAPTVAQVKIASYEGCHLCSLVLAVLQSCRTRYAIGIDVVPDNIRRVSEHSVVDVLVGSRDTAPYVRLEVKIPSLAEDEDQTGCCQLVSLGVTSGYSSSEGGLDPDMDAEDIARYWLADCLQNHGTCSGQIPTLPRRVIDVSNEKLRLFVSSGDEAQYTTLSYTIGGAHLVVTTSDNIADRQTGFDLEILPQAIQDAVWWTRQLGIQYLWIDSLCILQDALSDWEVELSTMSNIYRNATVTFAATYINNARQTCRPWRSQLTMKPCQIQSGITVMPDLDRLTWIMDRAPLDSRAWCLQEVELSRRVLRVGCEELAWQCRSGKRLQTDPTRVIVHEFGFQFPIYGSRILDGEEGKSVSGGDGHESKKKRPFNSWYSLVSRFSRKELSFFNDRLPALSGLAEYFHTRVGGTYIAGLWKEDIFHGLLWTMESEGSVVLYRSPSWSWAAVQGGYLSYFFQLLGTDSTAFEMLDVRVDVQGLNPFGRIRSASLTLFGSTTVLPSCCYGDDSNDGNTILWDTMVKLHLLRWDRGIAQIGCILFQLHEEASLILEPDGKGRFRRVGILVAPSRYYRDFATVMGMLHRLPWEERVATII